MNTKSMIPSTGAMIAFLSGAALGAAAIAFTTGKAGPERREDLARASRWIKGRYAGDGEDSSMEQAGDSARQAASAAWSDTKEGAAKLGADLKGTAGKVKADLMS